MKRKSQVLALLLAGAMAMPMTSTPVVAYAAGNEASNSTYAQLVNGSAFVTNFTYTSGINTGAGTAVFADTGETVTGSNRALAINESVTIKIPNGFKYYNGTYYDIYFKVTNTSATELTNNNWTCAPSDGYITVQPNTTSNTSFDYEIWLQSGDTRVKDVMIVAGSCYTADQEGARPYGDDGSVYTNIPVNSLSWDSNNSCWTPTGYDASNRYIIGHGMTSENSVQGGYVRKNCSGGAEMLVGYLVHTITFANDKDGGGSVTPSSSQVPEGQTITAPKATPDAGYYLKNWTADTDVTLNDGTVIKAGDPIAPDQISQIEPNTSMTITANFEKYTIKVEDDTKSGEDLNVYDGNSNLIASASVEAADVTYDGTAYNTKSDKITTDLTAIQKYFPNATVDTTKTTYYLAGVDGAITETKTNASNSGAATEGAAPKDAGTYYVKETINLDNSGTTKEIYTKYTISPKKITAVVTANDKYYDGTTDAAVKSQTVDTGVAGDSFTISGAEVAFTDKNAGTDKAVTVTNTSMTATPAAGTKADNYTITYPTATTAAIKKKDVNVTVTANNKAYDGNTNATVKEVTVNSEDLVKGESLTAGGVTVSFADASVGDNKTVNVDSSKATVTPGAGTDADNYNVIYPATTTANITKAANTATITNLDQMSKTYDGQAVTTPVVTATSTGAQTVKYRKKGEDDSAWTTTVPKDAGEYEVQVTVAADDNYDETTANGSFTISPKEITAVVTAKDKTYDGTKTATVDSQTVDTGIKGESFTISGAEVEFTDKNVGTDKEVTVTSTKMTATPAEGTNANNYTITYPTKTTADITAKKVTATVTAKDKPYNGKTDADVTTAVDTGITGETLEVTGVTGTFSDPNVGEGKTVTVDSTKPVVTPGDGTDAKNYEVTYPETTKANITKADQAAPDKDALQKTATPETIDGKNDGKIAGLEPGMQYRLKGSDEWITVTENNKDAELPDGTYEVRYAEDGNHKASDPVDVTVEKGKMLNVIVVPEAEKQVGYTLTSDKNEASWDDTATATFTVAEGYTMTDKFALVINGTKYTKDQMTPVEGKDGTYTFTISKIEEDKTISVEGVADVTPPTGEITITKTTWKEVINKVTFGKFFKNDTLVTINPTDPESGSKLKSIEYYVSDKQLTEDEIKAIGTTEGTGWTAYDQTEKFTIDRNSVNVVYAKLTDNAGNVTYLSSDGVVIYTDSEQDTEGITYTRTSKADVTAKVKLNDNTIKSIANGDKVLVEGTDYTVAEDGTITFKASYLESLPASDTANTLTISYNPKGLDYVDDGDENEAPETTTLNLKVVKASGTANIANLDQLNKTYDGEAITTPTVTAASTGAQTVVYRKKGTDDDAWTATVPVDAGDYEVKVTVAADDNYDQAEVTGDFTIAKKEITAVVTANDKVYDGTKTATVKDQTVETGVKGDAFTISGAAVEFTDKNAGSDKAVTVTNKDMKATPVGDTKADNYTIIYPTATTASITKKAVTAAATAKDKTYDGKTDAEVTITADTGIDGEKITVTGATGEFNTAAVGKDKEVTVDTKDAKAAAEKDTDLNNYEITYPTTTTASITKIPGEISITNLDKLSKTADGKAITTPTTKSNSTGKQTVMYRKKGESDDAWTTKAPTEAGEYEIKVSVAEDDTHTAAETTGTFKITAAQTTAKSTGVKTGDMAQPLAYGLTAGLSGIAAAVAAFMKRKKRK